MADQIITTYKADGLLKPTGVALQKVSATSVYATLVADISDCKDSAVALIDVPSSVTGKIMFSFLGNEENADRKQEVRLVNGKLNVIHMDTHCYQRADGTAKFFISTDSMDGLASHNIKITFIRYTPVVNH